jgi:2-phosphosulfolactate phosphatase
MYEQHKNDLYGFAPNITHYHRLVDRFGLIEDIRFCFTPGVADVLPLYKEGKLIKG